MIRHYSNIVLNIPHSTSAGVEDAGWPKTDEFKRIVNTWTDWHTDTLFSSDDERVQSVRFPISRFVVDAERLIDDPMEKIGQGIIYKRYDGFCRKVKDEKELMTYYYNHIEQLKEQLTPQSILIDCHSFPSFLGDVDVCIGYNDDWSRPTQEVIDYVTGKFTDAGYNVGINEPYSNSISPKCKFEYPSLMIELNKRIYMDEDTLELTDGAKKVKAILNEIYNKLLGL